MLNIVVVEVVVIVAAAIAHPEDLVDIVAVNVPALHYPACIGFPGAPGPAVIVIITDSVAAGDDLYPPAEGVVGVCRLGGFTQFNLDDTILVVFCVTHGLGRRGPRKGRKALQNGERSLLRRH